MAPQVICQSLPTSFVSEYKPKSFRRVLFISTAQGGKCSSGKAEGNNLCSCNGCPSALPIHQIKSGGCLWKSLWIAVWKSQHGLYLAVQTQNFIFPSPSLFYVYIFVNFILESICSPRQQCALLQTAQYVIKLALTPAVQYSPFHPLHSSTQLQQHNEHVCVQHSVNQHAYFQGFCVLCLCFHIYFNFHKTTSVGSVLCLSSGDGACSFPGWYKKHGTKTMA